MSMTPYKLVFVFYLLVGGWAAPQGQTWLPVPADMKASVEDAARNAVDALSLRQLFSDSANFARVVSSAHLPHEPSHFYIVMDVDKGGQMKLVPIEVYKEDNSWKLLLAVPGKNRKESAPETLTSLTDIWREVPTTHSLVLEAAPEAERLLRTYIFEASSSPPTLVKVLHSETRTRDIASELAYLIDSKEANEQEVQDAAANIIRFQRQLVEKLSTKATALDDAEKTTTGTSASTGLVDSLDLEVDMLNHKIASEEERQARRRAEAERASEAAKLLQAQVTETQQELVNASPSAPASYLLMVATFETAAVPIATSFNKLILMYKTSGGSWKLTHAEDFSL